jgi:geranylgeranyl pyrophosphate synthase
MNTMLKTTTHPLISEVEDRMRAQFAGNPSALVATIEQLILAGGKRIRPTIILLMGSMFDTEREALLNLAAAIEMMHTATLVHDDLVDEADQRRGSKTIHTRFTTSAAVLAGDLAFAAASKLAAAVESIPVMQKFSETLQFIVNGEIAYMFNDGSQADQESYYAWIHAKTASVFELAAGLAATLGSANPAEIDAAYQFGYNIGMASQVTDDVLDFSCDPSLLGKPAGNDLRQGTITLPTLLYFEAHPDGLDISAILNHNGNGHGDIESIIDAIRQSESIDQALQKADDFMQDGLDALTILPDTPARAELALLANQITQRQN